MLKSYKNNFRKWNNKKNTKQYNYGKKWVQHDHDPKNRYVFSVGSVWRIAINWRDHLFQGNSGAKWKCKCLFCFSVVM